MIVCVLWLIIFIISIIIYIVDLYAYKKIKEKVDFLNSTLHKNCEELSEEIEKIKTSKKE